MANKLQIKRSAVPGKVPTVADLDLGELAINTYDGKAYMKKNVSGVETVVLLTGAGAGDVLGPSSSGDNAIARFDATSGKIIQNSSATVDDDGNINALTMQASGTGANKMPVGTTAQRPSAPVTGEYRMNSTTSEPEWYDATTSTWVPFGSRDYQIEFLLIAGGGGGGRSASSGFGAGGGGAGGYVASSFQVVRNVQYSVVIGAGGAGATVNDDSGFQGQNSEFIVSAIGGGGGRRDTNTGRINGGSGGGGFNANAGGSGTSGQGFNGGGPHPATDGGCGGGGASEAGENGGAAGVAGAGGDGLSSSINGTATFRAGGGGGSSKTTTHGAGGLGGGGAGGVTGTAGTANTGGGGGGGRGGNGGNGGSGIVIIRYFGPQRGTGGTVTSAGGYTIHTFTSSGTFKA